MRGYDGQLSLKFFPVRLQMTILPEVWSAFVLQEQLMDCCSEEKQICSCIENYSLPYILIVPYGGEQYCSLCFSDDMKGLCLAGSLVSCLALEEGLGADGRER